MFSVHVSCYTVLVRHCSIQCNHLQSCFHLIVDFVAYSMRLFESVETYGWQRPATLWALVCIAMSRTRSRRGCSIFVRRRQAVFSPTTAPLIVRTAREKWVTATRHGKRTTHHVTPGCNEISHGRLCSLWKGESKNSCRLSVFVEICISIML